MKIVATMLASLLLTTSCTFVPVPKCELPKAEILAACSAPTVINKRQLYEDHLRLLYADRKLHSMCKLSHESLKKSLESCNSRIDNYNKLKGKIHD